MVLDDPPAPRLGKLARILDSHGTLITDRVGINLTRKDRVMYMQNNMAPDYWNLARKIERVSGYHADTPITIKAEAIP